MNEVISPDIYERTYGENIRMAEKSGGIVYANSDIDTISRDEWSHLRSPLWSKPPFGFQPNNMRELPESVRAIIKFRAEQTLSYLEFGPGGGRSAFQAYEAARESGANISIDTVSLTPIDPYRGITGTYDELCQRLGALLHSNPRGFADKLNKIIFESITGGRLLRLDLLLDLQENFHVEIFKILEEPFVRQQFIGYFPGDVSLSENSYDLMHEECGPLLYHANGREPVSASEVLRKMYRSLTPSGVLVVNPFNCEFEDPHVVADKFEDGDFIIGEPRIQDECEWTEDILLLESRLYRDIRELCLKRTVIARKKSGVAEKLLAAWDRRKRSEHREEINGVKLVRDVDAFVCEALAA